MGSSSLITLFSEPQQSSSLPSTFVLSLLLHAGVCSLLTVRMIEDHRIIERFPTNRFAVRVLDFHSTEPPHQASAGGIVYPGSSFAGPSSGDKLASGPSAASSPASLATRETAQLMPASQTLLQPDLPPNLVTFKKIPVPLVVLWSPEKAVPNKRIVPPLPDKPVIAVVRPSLDTPIKEENLADLRMPSTAFVTQTPSLPPSTTSPIVVHGPEEAQKVPETTSKQPNEPAPTPARVISLSDVRVADGTVVIPLVNETATKLSPGATAPGQLKDPSKPGYGASDGKSKDAGAGKAPAAPSAQGSGQGQGKALAGKGQKPAGSGSVTGDAVHTGAGNAPAQITAARNTASSATPSPTAAAAQSGAAAGQPKGAASGSGPGNQSSSVRISLPKDGQFGVVVVGSSITDQYPETAELWSGRMAATVYLHVGLARSWILQYALPRLVDAASVGGRLEAPWPYEIVRPNLDSAEADSQTIILHGYVTREGFFEKLELVFPSDFVQAPMVLNVLNEWQFRPAKQNGATTPVEVLLIIPSQSQ